MYKVIITKQKAGASTLIYAIHIHIYIKRTERSQ